MPYEAFHKAKAEIAEGKLGVARDRLRGLIHAYPCDLSIRTLLGDVNMQLGYTREAGRWWFLDEEITEEKQAAIDLFIAECKNDPSVILRRLKLKCHPDDLPAGTSRERIQAQIDECVRRGLEFELGKKQPPKSADPAGCLFTWACPIVLVVAFLLMLLGLASLCRLLAEGKI